MVSESEPSQNLAFGKPHLEPFELSKKGFNPVGSPKDMKFGPGAGEQNVLVATYEKGSNAPSGSHGLTAGFHIYARTPNDLENAKVVAISYKAYFPEGFQWVKGGKMPGAFGGATMEAAKKCSGGHREGGACFSTRMMWRADGAGELYAYLPDVANNREKFANVEPKTKSGDKYGYSCARGVFTWKTGAWTEITQRITLNDVGEQNGEIEVWIDDDKLIHVKGLEYRTKGTCWVRGMQIQTFFGGHDHEWSTPVTQHAFFKDFAARALKE